MAYTPSYPSLVDGQMAYREGFGATNDTAGANAKLWLPIWSGEVLHAYDEYRSFEPMVTSRTITSGREEQFPITGTVDLQPAWRAGEYLMGGADSKAGNFSITLDARPMAAHFELDNVDLMITQWEYRQELARQAGQTLANARDKQIGAFIGGAAVVELTSQDPRTGINLPEPAQIAGATAADRALEVLEAIEDFIVDCQENSVPVGQTFCAVTPRVFQDIRRLGVAESQPQAGNMQPMFGGVAAAGGLGAPLTQGMNALSDSLTYMGVTIIKSNHLPVDNYGANAAAAIGEDRYNVDGLAAGVKGLIWMPDCVASLRKTGLVVDTEDDTRRNSTFTVASMMSGTGILKPELAKMIVDDTVSAASAGEPTRAEIRAVFDTTAGFGYATS